MFGAVLVIIVWRGLLQFLHPGAMAVNDEVNYVGQELRFADNGSLEAGVAALGLDEVARGSSFVIYRSADTGRWHTLVIEHVFDYRPGCRAVSSHSCSSQLDRVSADP